MQWYLRGSRIGGNRVLVSSAGRWSLTENLSFSELWDWWLHGLHRCVCICVGMYIYIKVLFIAIYHCNLRYSWMIWLGGGRRVLVTPATLCQIALRSPGTLLFAILWWNSTFVALCNNNNVVVMMMTLRSGDLWWVMSKSSRVRSEYSRTHESWTLLIKCRRGTIWNILDLHLKEQNTVNDSSNSSN